MDEKSSLVKAWRSAGLRPGEPVVLMGPTGTPTHIAANRTVLLVGGGTGPPHGIAATFEDQPLCRGVDPACFSCLNQDQELDRVEWQGLREAEIANIPFLAALAGALRRCSLLVWLATRRSERLALHPASAPKNGILVISASLNDRLRQNSVQENRTARWIRRCRSTA